MTGTFRPSVRTSRGAVKSTWMRSSLRSLSLSNGAWTQTSPLYQSAGLVEKTAWARPLKNVGTAGCGAGAGAGAATRAESAPGLPGGSADAGLAATTVAKVIAVTAPARNRVLNPAPPEGPAIRSEPRIVSRVRRNRATLANPAGQGDCGLELAQRAGRKRAQAVGRPGPCDVGGAAPPHLRGPDQRQPRGAQGLLQTLVAETVGESREQAQAALQGPGADQRCWLPARFARWKVCSPNLPTREPPVSGRRTTSPALTSGNANQSTRPTHHCRSRVLVGSLFRWRSCCSCWSPLSVLGRARRRQEAGRSRWRPN